MRPIRCVRNCRCGEGRPALGVEQIDKRLAKQNVYSLLRYLKSHVRRGTLRRSIQLGERSSSSGSGLCAGDSRLPRATQTLCVRCRQMNSSDSLDASRCVCFTMRLSDDDAAVSHDQFCCSLEPCASNKVASSSRTLWGDETAWTACKATPDKCCPPEA